MKKLIAGIAVIGIAGLAQAEPTAYLPTSPFFDEVDPSLPSLELTYNLMYFGPGSGRYDSAPAILEEGVVWQDDVPPSTYWVEASTDGSSTGPYKMVTGDVIDGSLSDWVHPIRDFDCCGGVLPFTTSDRNGGDFGCWSPCDGTEVLYLPNDELRYMPFRYQDVGGGDWYYGYVAMRATALEVEGCTNPCSGNPTELATQVVSQSGSYGVIVGFALESEPNTPIVAGAGRCPADLTNDFTVDFFDISAFLGLYSDGNLDADMDGSGTLDFFDISEYITRYGDGCLF